MLPYEKLEKKSRKQNKDNFIPVVRFINKSLLCIIVSKKYKQI